MIPSESSANLQSTEAATQPNYDGFLYQCRVPPKISARVGGNRNGKQNGFHRTFTLRFFPGNECIVENGAISRLGTTDPRVLVLNCPNPEEGKQSQHKLIRRMKARDISGRERGL